MEEKNKHNFTSVNSIFDQSLCSVGRYTYGIIKILSSNNISKVRIGSFCSIGSNVVFIINNEHDFNNFSTYPFITKILTGEAESSSKGDIIIGDDVWFGSNSTILSGVCIGRGAVIGAGAVVANDIPPYAVVGGVPARIIKYRFTPDIIKKMETIDYEKIDETFIKNNMQKLYSNPSSEGFDWLPLIDIKDQCQEKL